MKQLLTEVPWQQLVAALVTCCSLIATLLVSRTNRWLREHLERERIASDKQISEIQERELRRSNATVKTLAEASSGAERVTLDSLLSNELEDFSLESSLPPSVPPPEFLPSTPTSRASSAARKHDWLDDEDVTELPFSPRSPRGSK